MSGSGNRYPQTTSTTSVEKDQGRAPTATAQNNSVNIQYTSHQ